MVPMHEQISGIGGAVTVSLIAFSVVFLVLGGLTAIIYGIKYLAAGMERKKGTGTGCGAAGGTPVSGSGAGTVSRAVGTESGKLLAVLAGAVAAASGGGGVRITGVTALGSAVLSHPVSGSAWRQAGIYEGHGGLSRDWR